MIPQRGTDALGRRARTRSPAAEALSSPSMADILVIGAGVAGLSAARALRSRGADVIVLEKSRGVGGRAASRTVHGQRIDHGTQFITVRDARFAAQVDAWSAAGVVREWSRGVARWTAVEGWQSASAESHPRYACPEGMSSIGKALAAGLDVRRETTVTDVRATGEGWTVGTRDGPSFHASAVIVTAPIPQALTMLADVAIADAMRSRLEAVAYAPCHAVAVGFVGAEAPAWPGVQLPEHPDLAWIAHDSSRRAPGTTDGVTLVLHATPGFSHRRFDDPPEVIVSALLEAARPLLSWNADPAWTYHHRWRYALPEHTLDERAIDVGPGLTLAGDAFGEGRLEGAYLSGLTAAEALGASKVM